MKKHLILSVLMAFAVVCGAQTYYPLIQDGEKQQQWNVLFQDAVGWPNVYHTSIQKIHGEIVLDNNEYKTVWIKSPKEAWKIDGAVREEDKRVYYRKYSGQNYQDEVLLYDFNLTVGDTISVLMNIGDVPLIVLEESEIEVNGEMRRQLGLARYYGKSSDIEEYWIEGVGSTFGFLYSGIEGWVGSFVHLLCYHEDDNLIWMDDNYDSCVMNSQGEYRLFASQGDEWYFNLSPLMGSQDGYYHMEVVGDTAILGHLCSKITPPYLGGNGDYQYVYEDNGVVYWYNTTINNFTELYHFNAIAGGTYRCQVDSCQFVVRVNSVENIEWEGHTYRVQHVSSQGGDYGLSAFEGDIIAGIGYVQGLFPNMDACAGIINDGTGIDYLRCYLENGELLYHEGDFDCDEISGYIDVWDGSYESFDTIHAGTADDPILIENAAQLAYFSHLQFCEGNLKYWKLTTDVDIANIEWNPIGYNDATTCSGFNGYFNGDGHTIYHLSNALFSSTYEGFIKNITVRDSEYHSNGEFGNFGYIAYAAPLIENCHNYGNITIETNYPLNVGGIAGECMTIKHCSNHGTITVNANGIDHCYAGGLAGNASIIEISYNTGDVNVNLSCVLSKVGGISGMIADRASNCYNAGNLFATSVGGIVAKVDDGINVDNCYYINIINSINNYGIPKSETEMKTQDFVELLNNGGNYYTLDINNINNGFPILITDSSYPVIGTEWYYEILNDNGSVTYQYLECAADTTIDNKRAKVIIKSNTLYDKDLITKITHEYVYSEGGMVYWWDKQSESFTTLYNFYANVGDEWTISVGNQSITMHVDAVDDTDYDGKNYRVLTVSDADGIFNGEIICGIGHTTSFFPEKLLNSNKDYRVEGMRCYWIDGEQMLHFGEVDCDEVYGEHHDVAENTMREFSVFPNPANGIVNIIGEFEQIQLIDIYGKVIEIDVKNNQINVSNLPSGMYFIKIDDNLVKLIINR